MKYGELLKYAYRTDDFRHPENATGNTALGAIGGALLVGAPAYLIAAAMGKDQKTQLIAGGIGAGIGAVGGGIAGHELLTDTKEKRLEDAFNEAARQMDSWSWLAQE